MKFHPKHFTLCFFAIAVMAAPTTAAATTYRWDTSSLAPVNGVPTITVGGSDFALAADLTSIQIIGHGTFSDGMTPTGGGTWTITQPSGTVFSGTFTVLKSSGKLFEGITATKSFVDFWDRVPPVPGVNANRTIFHVLP